MTLYSCPPLSVVTLRWLTIWLALLLDPTPADCAGLDQTPLKLSASSVKLVLPSLPTAPTTMSPALTVTTPVVTCRTTLASVCWLAPTNCGVSPRLATISCIAHERLTVTVLNVTVIVSLVVSAPPSWGVVNIRRT